MGRCCRDYWTPFTASTSDLAFTHGPKPSMEADGRTENEINSLYSAVCIKIHATDVRSSLRSNQCASTSFSNFHIGLSSKCPVIHRVCGVTTCKRVVPIPIGADPMLVPVSFPATSSFAPFVVSLLAILKTVLGDVHKSHAYTTSKKWPGVWA